MLNTKFSFVNLLDCGTDFYSTDGLSDEFSSTDDVSTDDVSTDDVSSIKLATVIKRSSTAEITPDATDRSCDYFSSMSTRIFFTVLILTGIIITLVLIVIIMGLVLAALTWKLIQTKRKLTQQCQ